MRNSRRSWMHRFCKAYKEAVKSTAKTSNSRRVSDARVAAGILAQPWSLTHTHLQHEKQNLPYLGRNNRPAILFRWQSNVAYVLARSDKATTLQRACNCMPCSLSGVQCKFAPHRAFQYHSAWAIKKNVTHCFEQCRNLDAL